MAEGRLIGFTGNYADNSTEAGFQFTFFCDIWQEGYKTRFIESKIYKKGKLLRGLGDLRGAVTQLTGRYGVSYGVQRTTDILSEHFQGMSTEWHKEHKKAFETAQNEARQHFKRCPKCTKWVCKNDLNEQDGLCVECAPRESIEVAAAHAEKRAKDIKEKAEKAKVFSGKIEKKQTICPRCGKPSGEGKFCIRRVHVSALNAAPNLSK
ncbi:MAG: zinc ribbon domain-containing protein [candidate division WOR-3 bacterium]|nr:zinc ribbon domain-containing protein [candidate division WOR-3 bacterium]